MRTRIIALATLVVLTVTGCAGMGDPDIGGTPYVSDTSSPLAGEWQLTSGSDATGDFALKDSVATLTLVGDTVGGRTPCNVFGADVTTSEEAATTGMGAIDITPTFQTEAACADADLMALEPRYLAALDAATQVTVSDTELTLANTEEKVVLNFESVPDVPTAQLVGTEWTLDAIAKGDAVSSVGGTSTLMLAEDGTISGNGGCNGFTGSWENSGGVIVVEELNGDLVECADVPVDQEQIIHAILTSGFTAEVDGDALTITDAEGYRSLVYRNR